MVLVLAAIVVPIVLVHRHYDEAIADFRDRLQRYQRVAAQAPEYRNALDALRQRDAKRFLLKNTAPNLAGAELQEIVRAAIEGNGGRITTSQNQPVKEEGRFKQIGVNVQFFATTANLQRILFAVESQQPYLLIDSLSVRPINAFRGFRPQPGQEPEVSVTVDVSAFSAAEAERTQSAVKPAAPNSSSAAKP